MIFRRFVRFLFLLFAIDNVQNLIKKSNIYSYRIFSSIVLVVFDLESINQIDCDWIKFFSIQSSILSTEFDLIWNSRSNKRNHLFFNLNQEDYFQVLDALQFVLMNFSFFFGRPLGEKTYPLISTETIPINCGHGIVIESIISQM